MARKKKSKTLRIAFIGAGGIAGTQMKALHAMDDVEIVAMADPYGGKMDKYQEEYGVDGAYMDVAKMLKEVKPDAVSVCSSNAAHAPNAIEALRAGCHVIVEKPMASNAREAQKMITTAKQKRKKLVIGFQYRYNSKTQFIKEAIADGQLGDVKYARVQALRRRGIPNWGVFYSKELQGGGPMIDIGVHCLEMCHYAMGSPKPVSAVGHTHTYIGNKDSTKIKSNWAGWEWKKYTVEDLAVGHINFDNGASLSIEASFAAHIEKNIWDFTLMGTKGGANWDGARIFTDEAGHMVNKEAAWLPGGGFPEMFHAKMRNFVDHVLYNKPTDAPAEHGLMVQKMLDAIYASGEKGGKVVNIK